MHRMLGGFAVALMVAGAAAAEPFAGTGYVLGCDETECSVFFAGSFLGIAASDNPGRIMAKLTALPPITAVALKGEITAMGDVTATAVLSRAKPVADDPFVAVLNQIQGDWAVPGAETPFHVRIEGFDWAEYGLDEESLGVYVMTPARACSDGAGPGGMVLSLWPMAGDPEEMACWQVVSTGADQLVLRDVTGGLGEVTYRRR